MDMLLRDANKRTLRITTDLLEQRFQLVTSSASTDAFTVLSSLHANPEFTPAMQADCRSKLSRGELCLLPVGFSRLWRVLLTPAFKPLHADSRAEAAHWMRHVFIASQRLDMQAQTLLITDLARVKRYPEQHLLGIFDALHALSGASFFDLELVCLELSNEHLERFARSGLR